MIDPSDIGAPGRAIAVLTIEDDEDDALLVIEALRADGYVPTWRRVASARALDDALAERRWDVILSDHNLPGFSGREALARVRAHDSDAPLILVSGTIGEERAVAFVKAGAADYVLKSNLERLPLAVARAIEDVATQRSRRAIEARLRASEARFRGLVEALPDLILVLDADGTLVDSHRPVGSRILPDLDDLTGARVGDLMPAGARAHLMTAVAAVAADGAPRRCECRLPRGVGDGDGHFEGHLSRMADGCVMVVLRDVTHTREVEARLRDILEHSTNLFYAHDPAHRLVYVSPQSRAFFDCEPAEAMVRWTELISDHPANAIGVERTARAIGTGEQQPPYELELLTRTGRRPWVEVNEAPVVRDGRTVMIVGALTDITARKRAEAEQARAEDAARAAQRMESIGRLAGGIAHDFNNLLSVILSYAALIREDLPASAASAHEDIAEIQEAGRRAAELTRQLLAFSRRQVLSPTVLDLNEVVADTEKMLRRVVGEDIVLETVRAVPLPTVEADRGQLEQILMNLVVNARDAMPDGGHLEIATAAVDVDADAAAARPPLPPGRYVQLQVRDRGAGIAAADLARVFEPFYTTKEPGKGTGLGLSTVYGIVKQSGGYIWIDSEVGAGTTVTILLPPSDAPAATRTAAGRGEDVRGGDERVLLVEDEPAVRAMTERILRRAGYQVIAAGNGDEALQACRDAQPPIALLLTDIVMPGLTGQALADLVTVAQPGVKVLFMSGYSDDLIAQRGLRATGAPLLAKPFTPEQLTRRVRELLDGG
ncbi:MAG: response regulator [Myxococcales bacterium]|nr:response regulator [Myxococcales bacterium]